RSWPTARRPRCSATRRCWRRTLAASDLRTGPESGPASEARAGSPAAPLLVVEDLSVRYGKVEAVHRVSLQLLAGQIVTVVGPNGAGKTTLMAAIMGLLPADGRISID